MLRFVAFCAACVLANRLVEAKRRADAARRKVDERYRLIAETAPDALFSINKDIAFCWRVARPLTCSATASPRSSANRSTCSSPILIRLPERN